MWGVKPGTIDVKHVGWNRKGESLSAEEIQRDFGRKCEEAAIGGGNPALVPVKPARESVMSSAVAPLHEMVLPRTLCDGS